MDLSTLTPRTFAYAIGTSYGQIKRLYYDAPISSHYKTFTVIKKHGGVRTISSPSDQLKHLQYKILGLLEPKYAPRKQVHGFVKGRNIVTNAFPHTRRKYVFNLDLEDFFSTITFQRVRGILRSKPYRFQPETASVIAHLCCVGGMLPQGAPTSPFISNIICAKLDAQLTAFAIKHKFSYTRYADDITFSFNGDINRAFNVLIEKESGRGISRGCSPVVADPLFMIIHDNGFSVNTKKVRIQDSSTRQVVTGLTVNKKVNVDRRFVRKTSAMIHSIEMNGIKNAQAKFSEVAPEAGSIVSSIHGRLLFVKQVKGVDSPVYRKLGLRFNDLNLDFRVPISLKNSLRRDAIKRRRFSSACWCVEVEAGDDILEGSSFMLEGDILVTNAHVIPNVPDPIAIKVGRPRERYVDADLVKICRSRDIAILKIKGAKEWPFFDLLPEEGCVEKFDDIILAGFPSASRNNTPFAPDITVSWGEVVLVRVRSGVEYCDINTNIIEGSSGGVVVNKALQVLGIAARGIADGGVGTNTFISTKTLREFLGTM